MLIPCHVTFAQSDFFNWGHMTMQYCRYFFPLLSGTRLCFRWRPAVQGTEADHFTAVFGDCQGYREECGV